MRAASLFFLLILVLCGGMPVDVQSAPLPLHGIRVRIGLVTINGPDLGKAIVEWEKNGRPLVFANATLTERRQMLDVLLLAFERKINRERKLGWNVKPFYYDFFLERVRKQGPTEDSFLEARYMATKLFGDPYAATRAGAGADAGVVAGYGPKQHWIIRCLKFLTPGW